MSITNGPNLGLMVNGLAGEAHYSQHMALLRGLDGLVMPSVAGYLTNTPPVSPADGVCYIIGAAPTGAWEGHGGEVARWSAVAGAYDFFVPKNGWTLQSASARETYRRTGGAWEIFTAINKAGDTGIGALSMGALTATFFNGFAIPAYTTSGLNWAIPYIPTIGGSGVIEIGKHIDFHETTADAADYSLRLSSLSGALSTNGAPISTGAHTATSEILTATVSGTIQTFIGVGGLGAAVKFADTEISGQILGRAYLQWDRGSSQDRNFRVFTSDAGGTSRQALLLDFNANATMNTLTATIVNPGTYTVATLPAGTNGASVYASDGRKAGEGIGAGTGSRVVYTNGAWRRLSDETAITA